MGNGSHGRRNPYSVEVSGSVRPATIFFSCKCKKNSFQIDLFQSYCAIKVFLRKAFRFISRLGSKVFFSIFSEVEWQSCSLVGGRRDIESESKSNSLSFPLLSIHLS